MFDLLLASSTLRRHAAAGDVGFGINHEMADFRNDRRKNLDLVLCQPATRSSGKSRSLRELATHYAVRLSEEEQALFAGLPALREAPVGNVLMALEAKACMTAHQRALPRLYDELNSSHATVHGAHDLAIAAGFVMINAASKFLSSDLNKKNRMSDPDWSHHEQPKSTQITIDKVTQLPRRSKPGAEGYDALAIVVVDCVNDGTPVALVEGPPAPSPTSSFHYDAMIDRLRGLYDTRFG